MPFGKMVMELKPEHKRQIGKIVSGMTCSKDFKCYKSGFANIGAAKNVGVTAFLECSEPNCRQCEFLFPFGYKYFCKRPLKRYAAKKLMK